MSALSGFVWSVADTLCGTTPSPGTALSFFPSQCFVDSNASWPRVETRWQRSSPATRAALATHAPEAKDTDDRQPRPIILDDEQLHTEEGAPRSRQPRGEPHRLRRRILDEPRRVQILRLREHHPHARQPRTTSTGDPALRKHRPLARRQCRTPTWATCSRTSSTASPSPPTREQASSVPRATSSVSWSISSTLMMRMLFAAAARVRSIYDPTVGTGGMLSVADEHLRSFSPDASTALYGQEINTGSATVRRPRLQLAILRVHKRTTGRRVPPL